jgi:hypothetical protein
MGHSFLKELFMKNISLIMTFLVLGQTAAFGYDYFCAATCFHPTKVDYNRLIVESRAGSLEAGFKNLKDKCLKDAKNGSFLRDYVYRGGVPIVNGKRHDYALLNKDGEKSGPQYFCKSKMKKIALLKLDD